MRNKLIDILMNLPYGFKTYDEMADQLLANGVTVQEWIPVSERLPEKSDDYLCAFDGYMDVIPFSAKHKAFNAYDSVAARFVEESKVSPTHWMPLPEPPKGE